MTRHPALALAALVVAGALTFPSPAAQPVGAVALVDDTRWSAAMSTSAVAGGDIVPGSVDRSSPILDATYAASLAIAWGPRTIRVDSTVTIRNTSGGPIDRVELNTVAARLGAMRLGPVTVDGGAVSARVTGQTITVPLGGILPVGGVTAVRVRFEATVRSDLSGSNWLFTRTNGVMDLYRWLPWVSRRLPFDRPNHGDPFVTPTSRQVDVRIDTGSRTLVLATTGARVGVSANGRVQTFRATNVRDFTVTAALDYRTKSRVVAGTTIRVWYRPGGPGTAMLDAAADAFGRLRAKLGPYPHPTLNVVQSAGGYGMESPGLIWIPTGVARANLRYLAAHETAHQWFYGSVGNDQAAEPFVDEAAADFAARSVLDMRRGSRCATARLDRSIYDYSARCYYEIVYIQGGNLLAEARRRMGPPTFWAAVRAYLSTNRGRIVTTRTLLQALDGATPVDLGRTLFDDRFPRLY